MVGIGPHSLELVDYVERLVTLYNRDLAEGLDLLEAVAPNSANGSPVESFSLGLEGLAKIAANPAIHQAAYLVDMAKVEALDTMGEHWKAVELLDRHV